MPGRAARWAARRPIGSPRTARRCRRWRRKPGGGARHGCRAITTAAWIPTIIRCIRRGSAAGSRSSRIWAWHQTLSEPRSCRGGESVAARPDRCPAPGTGAAGRATRPDRLRRRTRHRHRGGLVPGRTRTTTAKISTTTRDFTAELTFLTRALKAPSRSSWSTAYIGRCPLASLTARRAASVRPASLTGSHWRSSTAITRAGPNAM